MRHSPSDDGERLQRDQLIRPSAAPVGYFDVRPRPSGSIPPPPIGVPGAVTTPTTGDQLERIVEPRIGSPGGAPEDPERLQDAVVVVGGVAEAQPAWMDDCAGLARPEEPPLEEEFGGSVHRLADLWIAG